MVDVSAVSMHMAWIHIYIWKFEKKRQNPTSDFVGGLFIYLFIYLVLSVMCDDKEIM